PSVLGVSRQPVETGSHRAIQSFVERLVAEGTERRRLIPLLMLLDDVESDQRAGVAELCVLKQMCCCTTRQNIELASAGKALTEKQVRAGYARIRSGYRIGHWCVN